MYYLGYKASKLLVASGQPSQLVLVIISPQLFTNKYFYTFFKTNAGLDDFKKLCPVSCEYLGLQQQKRIFALDGYNSQNILFLKTKIIFIIILFHAH